MKLFALLLTTLLVSGAFASEYKRVVNMEWEPIEGAKSYEMELSPVPMPEGAKPLLEKTVVPDWSGPLVPGTYSMRIRAKDKRNVPGAWSSPEEFKVNIESVKLTSPKTNEMVKSDEIAEVEVDLKWQEVGGAKDYVVEVQSEDGIFSKTQVADENELSLVVPVAKKYTWKVLARYSDAIQSDATAVDQFSVIGKKLKTPEIAKPANEFVRDLRWTTPEFAETYDYVIFRLDPKTKKWESISQTKDTKENALEFDNKWPGGRYKMALRAKSNLRENSGKTEIQFKVFKGDRSPATEFTQTVRQSIDRTKGFYAIGSYLISTIDFKGTNYDKLGSTNFQSIAGTGRLGLGYLGKNSPWGGLGILDFSGITVEDQNFTFASGVFDVIYRGNNSERGESRHYIGAFYKELPDIQGNGLGTYTGTEKIASQGPHYGYEYWYALTPKFGMQVNAHVYYNMFKAKTPNDRPILPSTSYQLGILGSYRWTNTITGLIGYAYRLDTVSYKANNDQTNSIEVEGHYLNLFLEWSL